MMGCDLKASVVAAQNLLYMLHDLFFFPVLYCGRFLSCQVSNMKLLSVIRNHTGVFIAHIKGYISHFMFEQLKVCHFGLMLLLHFVYVCVGIMALHCVCVRFMALLCVCVF